MKRLAKLLGLTLVLSAVAFAAAFKGPMLGPDLLPRWMKAGFYSGAKSTLSTSNQVTNMLAQSFDYDFPAIAPGYSIHNTLKTFTITGVKVGDPCFAGVGELTPNGDDGGSAWPFGMNFTAVARAADTVELVALNAAGDGGTFDMPDSGYTIRCISNQ